MLVCVSYKCTLHTRPRVQRAPGLPCALSFGASGLTKLGRSVSRECGVVFEGAVIARSESDEAIHSLITPRDGLLRFARNDLGLRRTGHPAYAGRGVTALWGCEDQIKTPPGIGRRLNSVVQRSLEATLHRNPENSISVAGVDPIELAQQRRPHQVGRAQFHAI